MLRVLLQGRQASAVTAFIAPVRGSVALLFHLSRIFQARKSRTTSSEQIRVSAAFTIRFAV